MNFNMKILIIGMPRYNLHGTFWWGVVMTPYNDKFTHPKRQNHDGSNKPNLFVESFWSLNHRVLIKFRSFKYFARWFLKNLYQKIFHPLFIILEPTLTKIILIINVGSFWLSNNWLLGEFRSFNHLKTYRKRNFYPNLSSKLFACCQVWF
jgi:hypothetical protein